MSKKTKKKARWKIRSQNGLARFATDKEGHYDLDGVSYSPLSQRVVVASDGQPSREAASSG